MFGNGSDGVVVAAGERGCWGHDERAFVLVDLLFSVVLALSLAFRVQGVGVYI